MNLADQFALIGIFGGMLAIVAAIYLVVKEIRDRK